MRLVDVVPIGATCLFVYLVITVLGWWRPVFYDPKPVRRWVWSIPDHLHRRHPRRYRLSAARGPRMRVGAFALVAATLLVGFSEEGMFRVIGVTSFRRHGFSEGKVALWTSVLFGLVHVANLIGGDDRTIVQAVVVSFAGYFFYLVRRVSRSNILNSVLHAGFDFAILSGDHDRRQG